MAIKSKVSKLSIAVMMLMSIFTGVASASADVVIEPDKVQDVSDQKSGAYNINCPDNSMSLVYQADIDTGQDDDWFKADVNSGDEIDQYLDNDAYQAYVAMYSEDANGNMVERLSKAYSDKDYGPVDTPPVYFKVSNDDLASHEDYEFFIGRNNYM